MEKIYLDEDKYDAVIDAYRSRHGYEDMSEEEKEAFDARVDKAVAKKDEEADPSENTDPTDPSGNTDGVDSRSDSDKLKDELRRHYGYENMSDDQKRIFDEKLDEVVEQETSGPDQPEKVLRRVR